MAIPAIKISLERALDDMVIDSNEFWLQIESMSFMHDRTPIVSTLPEVEPILIDLGQWKVNIKLEGVADKTRTSLQETISGVKIAQRHDLENIGGSGILVGSADWHVIENNIVLRDYSDNYDNTEDSIRKYIVKVNSLTINYTAPRDFVEFILSLSGYQVT